MCNKSLAKYSQNSNNFQFIYVGITKNINKLNAYKTQSVERECICNFYNIQNQNANITIPPSYSNG